MDVPGPVICCQEILAKASVSHVEISTRMLGGLDRREFDLSTDVVIPTADRCSRTVSDFGTRDHRHDRDRWRLPKPRRDVVHRDPIEGHHD
nr:hypothetical protein [Candidatus Methylacidiphilum infernorum]